MLARTSETHFFSSALGIEPGEASGVDRGRQTAPARHRIESDGQRWKAHLSVAATRPRRVGQGATVGGGARGGLGRHVRNRRASRGGRVKVSVGLDKKDREPLRRSATEGGPSGPGAAPRIASGSPPWAIRDHPSLELLMRGYVVLSFYGPCAENLTAPPKKSRVILARRGNEDNAVRSCAKEKSI